MGIVTRKYNASGAVYPTREIASYENLFEEVVGPRSGGKIAGCAKKIAREARRVNEEKERDGTRGETRGRRTRVGERGRDRPNNIAAVSVFTRREVLEQPVGWFVTAATPLTSN